MEKYINIYVLLNFGEDPSSIKEVMSMCSIAPSPHPHTHLTPPHPPRCPISIFSISHDTPLPMCSIAHVSYCPHVKKDVKLTKDVKLSKKCQMSKGQTHGLNFEEVHKKIN